MFSRFMPLIPQMISNVPELTKIAPANKWEIKKINQSLSDMNVLWVGQPNSEFTVVLHIPRSDGAVSGFVQQKKMLAYLNANEDLGEWRQVLPDLLYTGRLDGRPYWIEAQLPGISANRIVSHVNNRQQLLCSIENAISFLHRITAKEVTVNDNFLDHWVRQPIQTIHRSNLFYYHHKSYALLTRLEKNLITELRGQNFKISWIHGDFWLGNVLVTPDGSQVTGIVDWESSQIDNLPILDLITLLVTTRREIQGIELGKIIVEIHKQNVWEPEEQNLWDRAARLLGGKTPSIRQSLMLFWIWHLSANLSKSKRFSVNPIWAVNNFRSVIKYLEKSDML